MTILLAGVNNSYCSLNLEFILNVVCIIMLCSSGAKAVTYFCSASTARHLYLRGGVGVGSMIKIYGGRKRNGVCPSHFSVGSKNVARKVLQSLEALKLVEKDPNG